MGSCLSSVWGTCQSNFCCTENQYENTHHTRPGGNNYTALQPQVRRPSVDQNVYTITTSKSQVGHAVNPVASRSSRRVVQPFPVALHVPANQIHHTRPGDNYYTGPQRKVRRTPVNQNVYTITAPRSQVGTPVNPSRKVVQLIPNALDVPNNQISPAEDRQDHTYSFAHQETEIFEKLRHSLREIRKRFLSGEDLFTAASGSIEDSLERRLRGLCKDDRFPEDYLNLNRDKYYVELHIRQLMLGKDLNLSQNELLSENDEHQLFDRYSALRGSSIRRPLPNIALPLKQLSLKRKIQGVEQENLVRRLENLNHPILISGFMHTTYLHV